MERTFFEKLMDANGAQYIDTMFCELRCLVNSWGAWPKENRPSMLQCAVVLVIYAQAIAVKRGRWW